ncbi:MAG: sigma-70 family RNA polymerase sigma factor [Flavobacteriales bacterium]|nr:sigma-70 family RNA polymerase sigma factor [Flavobacteriales bacterium]HQV76012.1 sigma-70 family RNA polymerase sigma factor [Flavobacteriales bacterium]
MVDDEITLDGLRSSDRTIQARVVNALYLQVRAPLMHYVKSNGGSAEEARETIQDAIVTVYQMVSKPDFVLRAGVKLSTLANVIGRNLWLKQLNRYKKRYADNALSIEEHAEEESTPMNLMIEVEENKLVAEQGARAWAAFEQLGPDCQFLLRLTMNGRSDEEIMTELGMTNVGSVKVKRHRCQQKLAELHRKLTMATDNAGA